jgi:hypothetical protein
MNFTVGFRKEDGSIGIAAIEGCETYQEAAELVKNATSSPVALVLVKG